MTPTMLDGCSCGTASAFTPGRIRDDQGEEVSAVQRGLLRRTRYPGRPGRQQPQRVRQQQGGRGRGDPDGTRDELPPFPGGVPVDRRRDAEPDGADDRRREEDLGRDEELRDA